MWVNQNFYLKKIILLDFKILIFNFDSVILLLRILYKLLKPLFMESMTHNQHMQELPDNSNTA